MFRFNHIVHLARQSWSWNCLLIRPASLLLTIIFCSVHLKASTVREVVIGFWNEISYESVCGFPKRNAPTSPYILLCVPIPFNAALSFLPCRGPIQYYYRQSYSINHKPLSKYKNTFPVIIQRSCILLGKEKRETYHETVFWFWAY